MGFAVGDGEGSAVGAAVGNAVGFAVGEGEGTGVGTAVGDGDGLKVGKKVGLTVGNCVGADVAGNNDKIILSETSFMSEDDNNLSQITTSAMAHSDFSSPPHA